MSATERPNKMPQLEESASPELRLYWDLVRRLANAPEEVQRCDVDRVCAAAERSRDQLHADVSAALERRRLLIACGSLLNLEVSCEVAAEGYRMMRESARRAREEAAAREDGAREVWRILKGRLEGALAAERRLRELLPAELAEELTGRRERVLSVMERLEAARRERRCVEHMEADLEAAEDAWREVRDLVW